MHLYELKNLLRQYHPEYKIVLKKEHENLKSNLAKSTKKLIKLLEEKAGK